MCDLGAPGHGQGPALAEVVLHVDDDQRALHDVDPRVQHPFDDLGQQVVPQLPDMLAGTEVGRHVDALVLQRLCDETPVALHQAGSVLGAGGHMDTRQRAGVGPSGGARRDRRRRGSSHRRSGRTSRRAPAATTAVEVQRTRQGGRGGEPVGVGQSQLHRAVPTHAEPGDVGVGGILRDAEEVADDLRQLLPRRSPSSGRR